MSHSLGWQDQELAEVWCTNRKVYEESFTIVTDEARECPHCGKWLILKWDVEAVEVPAP